MHLFIIGPGSVGKTTVGAILAKKLNQPFIDLDEQFMKNIGHIGDYIDTNGMLAYRERNTELLADLLNIADQKTVFALSSGFLVPDINPDLVKRNEKLLAKHGRTVLLLPASTPEEAVDEVVRRAMTRPYLNARPKREREKYLARHQQYQEYKSDIQIYSAASPETIADLMVDSLLCAPSA